MPENFKGEESDLFYDKLHNQSDMYNNMDHVVIAGDLNAKVGNQTIENVIGPSGEPSINRNGIRLREIANANKLKVTNTFF